jgi:hypothetical protein
MFTFSLTFRMCLLSEAKVARKVLAETPLFEMKGIVSGDYTWVETN